MLILIKGKLCLLQLKTAKIKKKRKILFSKVLLFIFAVTIDMDWIAIVYSKNNQNIKHMRKTLFEGFRSNWTKNKAIELQSRA